MKIAEDLYFYSKDVPFSYFFGRGFSCNRYAIDQGDEIWMIDSGTSAVHRVKTLLKQIRKDGLDPKRISKVIATHGHGDHVNGFPALSKEIEKLGGKVELFIHELDSHFVVGGDDDFVSYLKQAAGEYSFDLFPAPPFLLKILSKYSMGKAPKGLNPVTLKDNDILKGSRYSLHIYHTPGHSEGHICPYLIEKKALFLGDLIDQFFDHKPPVNLPSSDFMAFKKSLKRVQTIDIEIFCSAHGKDIPRGIDHNRKYVEDVLKQLYFGYNRTIELLAQKKEAKISYFSGKYPNTIWQFQEQKTLPFSVFKYLKSIGVIQDKDKKFSLIGKAPSPDTI